MQGVTVGGTSYENQKWLPGQVPVKLWRAIGSEVEKIKTLVESIPPNDLYKAERLDVQTADEIHEKTGTLIILINKAEIVFGSPQEIIPGLDDRFALHYSVGYSLDIHLFPTDFHYTNSQGEFNKTAWRWRKNPNPNYQSSDPLEWLTAWSPTQNSKFNFQVWKYFTKAYQFHEATVPATINFPQPIHPSKGSGWKLLSNSFRTAIEKGSNTALRVMETPCFESPCDNLSQVLEGLDRIEKQLGFIQAAAEFINGNPTGPQIDLVHHHAINW